MVASRVTFGQLLGLLRRLGFSTDEVGTVPDVREPVRVCRHAAADAVVLLRDRRPDEPAYNHELLSTKVQLDYRGLLPEAEFDQFVAGASQPAKASGRTSK